MATSHYNKDARKHFDEIVKESGRNPQIVKPDSITAGGMIQIMRDYYRNHPEKLVAVLGPGYSISN